MSDTQEVELAEAEKAVDLFESLQRLRANPDFIALIEKGYLESEAVRLVHARGNVHLDAKTRELVLQDIDAIGSFSGYLNSVIAQGAYAKDALVEYRQGAI
jgi:hypothetical protein